MGIGVKNWTSFISARKLRMVYDIYMVSVVVWDRIRTSAS